MHRPGLTIALTALLALIAATAPAQDLVFTDGFGSGDLWGWDLLVGGTTAVGQCPCDVAIHGTEFFVDAARNGEALVIPRSVDLHWSSGADFLQGNFIQRPLENMDYDFSQVVI